MLILLGGFIPESAKFLLQQGRRAEAQLVMSRFGSRVRTAPAPAVPAAADRHPPLVGRAMVAKLAALSVAGITWGLINFGVLLWLPADLVAKGYSMALSSKLLAESALIAFPTVFAVAYLYSRWSTKWSVVATLGVTILGLILLLRLELAGAGSPVIPVGLLIVGSNGLIAVLLPFTAESFPLHIRGRSTGWVAACSKLGGVFAQLLSIAAIIPALSVAALGAIVPTALGMVMIAVFGRETRGRDLRTIDRPLQQQVQPQ
jgi:putative MFS transporter